MINNSKKLFKAMYLVLYDLWKNNQAEDLRIYVADADPLFCNDGMSLDPVVSNDFDSLFEKYKDKDISDYSFIVLYLENLDPFYGDIKKYFMELSEEEFKEKLASLS